MSREISLVSCLSLSISIHLLVEQEQHIQGRVTWSESKLMIRNQAIGEEEGFNVGSDDGFHDLADDWEKADWSVVAGICFCTFLCRAVMFADFQADDLEEMRG